MTTTTRRQRRSWGKIRRLTHGSGRLQASYMHNLARHTAPQTFTAKMDAEFWLASERRLIECDMWTPPAFRAAQTHAKAQTFIEYADTWLEHRTLKPRTRALYHDLLDGPLAPLHRVPLGLISAESVRAWHAGLGTATPRKREHAYQLLHAILATAVTDGRIASNPAHIRGAMNSPAKRQAVILTPEEITKVALTIQPPMLKALVLVSAWCGLRWGEITELRRKDVSVDCSVLVVARGVTHRDGQCYIDSPKSGRVRSIRQDLADHLTHHVAAAPDALLWPAPIGCHYSERTFRDRFAAALRDAGIGKRVRIHDLRHASGTMAAQVGNLTETMARLGHSTVKASLLYQQVASGRDAEVAAALSDLAAKIT